MKKMNRFILSVSVMLSVVFGCSIDSSANTAHSQSEAVNWASSQIGQGLDYDRQYGNQCVDLIKYYYDYLGYANYAMGNANAYITNDLPSGWTRVYSDFQPGDIAVWKVDYSSSTCRTGSMGHVGIITSADSVGFNAVNQNYNNNPTCTQNWFWCSDLQCAIRPDFHSSGSTTPSQPQSVNIYYTDVQTTEVLNNTGNTVGLFAYIQNPGQVNIEQAGVQIWDSTGRLVVDYIENVNLSYSRITQEYPDIVGIDHLTSGLVPGESYTYQFYAVYGGQRYMSDVGSFTTPGSSQGSGDNAAQKPEEQKPADNTALTAFTRITVTELTDTTAVIKTEFPERYIKEWGYYWGADKNNLKYVKADSGNATTTWLRVSYAKLNPGTTYYMYFYYTTDSGVTVRSDLQSFTTKAAEKKEYTVMFNANGGTVSGNANKVTVNQKLGSLPSAYRSGYTFDGWYTSRTGGNKIYTSSVFSGDMVVYAHWTKVKSDSSSSDKYGDVDSSSDRYDFDDDSSSGGYDSDDDSSAAVEKVKVPSVKLKKAKSTKAGRMSIEWKKSAQVSGYQIMYSTKKSFKGNTTKQYLVKNFLAYKKTFTKLKKGKTYYVKIRAYKNINGKRYYGKWSSVKKVKIKK